MMLNDGSKNAPALRVYMNLGNLDDLPQESVWFARAGDRDAKLVADGFEGVQLNTDSAPTGTLPFCGLDRINTPADADTIAAKHAARGDSCITVHLGWGIEDDGAVDRLVESVLAASSKHRLPIFVETHRATITQDLWRTVRITERFPEIRFNCDFSHYYCGQEMPYGDWKQKLDFMSPIFERTGFMHGRIASSGCMQVPLAPLVKGRPTLAHGVVDYLEHFRQLWTRAMKGFKQNAVAGDVLIFAPELLAGTHYYARKFPTPDGSLREESDRYAEAILYAELARELFC